MTDIDFATHQRALERIAALEASNAQLRAAVEAAPLVPTEAQWGGLARDIMMWLDMHEAGGKTPRNLFLHLERLGRDIPQWLRDEPELQDLDHVPSKGTRCTIIYRAMLEAYAARLAELPPREG